MAASLLVSRRALRLALVGAGLSATLFACYMAWRARHRRRRRHQDSSSDASPLLRELLLSAKTPQPQPQTQAVNGCCGCACHRPGVSAAVAPEAPPSTAGGRRSRKRGSVRSFGGGRRHHLVNGGHDENVARLLDGDAAAALLPTSTVDGNARSGIDALHRVIWDLEASLETFDAGTADPSGGASGGADLLAELRHLLESAYRIRERAKQRALALDERYLPSTDVSDQEGSDSDSFVSALEQLDMSDLDEQMRLATAHLYRAALLELENGTVPFRKLRTAALGCASDTEYLARLHCIRLAMDQLMTDRQAAGWFRLTGREVGAQLLDRLGCDVQPFEAAYQELLQFLDSPEAADAIRRDLTPKGVRVFGLYDIVVDYLLLDAIEELASPPPSIVSVLQNRWLSAGFKRTALDSTVWTLVLAKRKMLGGSRGFSYHFYGLCACLGPALAWGFLGPDPRAQRVCAALKDCALRFAGDIFSPQCVRFTSVEELAVDIQACAQRSVRGLKDRLAACDVE